MISDLKEKSVIKRSELSEKEYTESLIRKAYDIGVFNTVALSKIQSQLLELLKINVKKYIGIDNSSILVDEAKMIMESNLYTIGLYLKRMSPDDGIKKLMNENIVDLYYSGRKILNRKISLCKILYHKVLDTMIKTENETYNSTVLDGINAFFKIYNPDYDARNIKITADYPLYNNLFGKLEGVEFVEEYLKSIYYENVFCKMFLENEIEEMLYGYNKNYSGLIINIFTLVLVRVIGSIMIEKENETLIWNSGDRVKLYNTLYKKSKKKIYNEVIIASRKIKVKNINLSRYIEKGICEAQFEIYNAMQLNKQQSEK